MSIEALLFGLVLGFFIGWMTTLERVEEIHPETYEIMIQEVKDSWDRKLDGLKSRSKKDKIEELEKQIESLKEE